MLLVDEIVHSEPGRAIVRGRLRGSCPLVRDASAPALIALEYMAQAAACVAGLQSEGGAGGGMLLGARELNLATGAFAVGETLEIEAKREMAVGDLVRFRCEVRREGRLVADAQLDVREAVGGGAT